jgi:hypothetical protein
MEKIIFFGIIFLCAFVFSLFIYLRNLNKKTEEKSFRLKTAQETNEDFLILNWGDSWKDFLDFRGWKLMIKKFFWKK